MVLLALATLAELGSACRSNGHAGADAGAQAAPAPAQPAALAGDAPRPVAPPPPAEASDAAVIQKRGDLIDQDIQQLAADALKALRAGDVKAVGELAAPGVDAPALVKKLAGRLGAGEARFEDAVVTPQLVELRFGVTFDVDAEAPRYLHDVHLLFRRVEGFLPWRLADAFVPGE
jgi:hypothetical protein